MLLDWTEIDQLVTNALKEDIGRGDLTTAVAVPADTRGTFTLRARHPLVVAGVDIAAFTFRKLVPDCDIEIYAQDGAHAETDAAIAKVSGAAPGLLEDRRAVAERRVAPPRPRVPTARAVIAAGTARGHPVEHPAALRSGAPAERVAVGPHLPSRARGRAP